MESESRWGRTLGLVKCQGCGAAVPLKVSRARGNCYVRCQCGHKVEYNLESSKKIIEQYEDE